MTPSADLIKLFYELWDDTRTAREYLVSADVPDSADRLPRSRADDVHAVLINFNRIGHLIASEVLDGQFVASLVGKEILRVVARARPFLEAERSRRGDPRYAEFVDRLEAVARAAHPDYVPWYPPAEDRRTMGLRV